jgi:hypothetical protein
MLKLLEGDIGGTTCEICRTPLAETHGIGMHCECSLERFIIQKRAEIEEKEMLLGFRRARAPATGMWTFNCFKK